MNLNVIIDDVYVKLERSREPELCVAINNQTDRAVDISGWFIIVTEARWKPGFEANESKKPWFVLPKNIKGKSWMLKPGCKVFIFDEKGEVEVKEEGSRVNYYFYTKPEDASPLASIGFSLWYNRIVILFNASGKEMDHKRIKE